MKPSAVVCIACLGLAAFVPFLPSASASTCATLRAPVGRETVTADCGQVCAQGNVNAGCVRGADLVPSACVGSFCSGHGACVYGVYDVVVNACVGNGGNPLWQHLGACTGQTSCDYYCIDYSFDPMPDDVNLCYQPTM